ncbi:hypothetical protein MPSEU_000674300 [Mayamaea pseudoterrestris]|nr:hypothetical protein MPSEU_000674300 [Mayamaea pseudoterrestris]
MAHTMANYLSNDFYDARSPTESDPLLLLPTTTSDNVPTASPPSSSSSSTDENNQDEDNHLHHWQRRFGTLAQLLCLPTMGVASVWIHLLGGLGWRPGRASLAFNWHIFCMTTAFMLMTLASLAFRVSVFSSSNSSSSSNSRWMVKFVLHALPWVVAGVCLIMGIVGVFHAHDDPISGLIANLYSLHSWIGVLVLALYFYQLFAGASTFGVNVRNLKPTETASALRLHTALGPAIYLCMAVTILLGIQDKEDIVGCRYRVTKVTYWPQLDKVPVSCLASHALAFLIVFITVFTLFAMHRFN